ncbi:MAG: TlyA family RNA methyltransferase [Candidatus Pacebacteria bacterium]|jgi:23S rRNA (cytidine1920-2'-O)/16S rRNA (cytidine1409-2'-O)-methyltransferase|nr:TlyA family RNA methyltransferase [Candidatus Paceibacterota bacterium]
MKKRIDITLVEKGLARSRTQAAELVRAKKVIAGGTIVEKPSMIVDEVIPVEVTEKLPYVGRGGLKLAHALKHFNVNVAGLTAVDIGASTGGFTDCLLQNDAKKVYAIDVGHSQLVPELCNDPRVISMESTDIREATLPELADIAVVDVSFISLANIFTPMRGLLKEEGSAIVLIKPQFEVGKGNLGKGGVVKDEEARQNAIKNVLAKADEIGFSCLGITDSPILGGEGNKEYLAFLKKKL